MKKIIIQKVLEEKKNLEKLEKDAINSSGGWFFFI
jgi:hypothetical protein